MISCLIGKFSRIGAFYIGKEFPFMIRILFCFSSAGYHPKLKINFLIIYKNSKNLIFTVMNNVSVSLIRLIVH